jgi:hypothetical protein
MFAIQTDGRISASPVFVETTHVRSNGEGRMRNLRMFLAAVVTAALAALLLAPGAGATAPIPIPPNPDASYPAGDVCPFPVAVHATQNGSLLHQLSNGQVLITGKLTQQVTNLSTGASRTYRVNGPLRVIPHDDGSFTLISHGRILFTSFAQDAGGPGIFVSTGRVVIHESADGFATSVSRAPRIDDVCADLD